MPTSIPYPVPRPTAQWTMCTAKEARERTRHKELSVFELIPHTLKPDPASCLQKYRRSAAGGGVTNSTTASTGGGGNPRTLSRSLSGVGRGGGYDGDGGQRTLDQLASAVDYLLGYIFARQRNYRGVKKNPLCETVNFMQDRIRAIQVDLTTSLGHGGDLGIETRRKVRCVEAKLIRYGILSQYLLSDLDDKKVQWKFMNTSLRTSLSAYFATWHNTYSTDNPSPTELAERDEIISYAALLHISTVLRRRETGVPIPTPSDPWVGVVCEDGEGISALLGLYRRYVGGLETVSGKGEEKEEEKGRMDEATRMRKTYPKWTWALDIAGAADDGDFLRLLRLLAEEEGEGGTVSATPEEREAKLREPLSDGVRWKILVRCCMAQILPLIRVGLVRKYNKMCMKGEKVSGEDLARLLHLPDAAAAISFCTTVGLPIHKYDDGTPSAVKMKSVPRVPADDIPPDSLKCIANPGRDEDFFVFGSFADLFLNYEEVEKIIDPSEQESMSNSPLGLLLNLEKVGGISASQSGGGVVFAKSSSNLEDSSLDDSFETDFDESGGLGEEAMCWGSFRPRVDIDRVKILPSPTMWELVG